MRLVTMSVLTISDLDVCLTAIFLANMGQRWLEGLMFQLGLCLVVVGFCTYSIGVLYFGPRQKTKVMKLVIAQMQAKPQDFESFVYKKNSMGKIVDKTDSTFLQPTSKNVRIELSTQLSPTDARQRSSPQTFQDLDRHNAKHRHLCQSALYHWGAGHMWQAIAVKNSWNCCNFVHGVPFVRTGRFGFMSQPSPQDLGGILNANALFSFSVGTLQLGFGAFMLYIDGFDVNTLVPLSVSTVSFVLSLCNVVFDFAATLATLDGEAQMAESIQSRVAATTASDKQDYIREKDTSIAAAVEEYNKSSRSEGALLARQKREEAAQSRYDLALNNLLRRELTELETELNAFRLKCQQSAELLKGGRIDQRENASSAPCKAIQKNLEALDKQKEKIMNSFNDSIEKLDFQNDFVKAQEQLSEAKQRQADALKLIDETKAQIYDEL